MDTLKAPYSLVKQMPEGTSFEDAVAKTKEAFTGNGFGLPPGTTQLDMPAILKAKKLSDDYDPTMIFGFCNPKVAMDSLTKEPATAFLIPCNVCVRQFKGGKVEVGVIEPWILQGIVSDKDSLHDNVETLRGMVTKAMAALPGKAL